MLFDSNCLCLSKCTLVGVLTMDRWIILLLDLTALITFWYLTELIDGFIQNGLTWTLQLLHRRPQMMNYRTILSSTSTFIFFCWAFLKCTLLSFCSFLLPFISHWSLMVYLIDFANWGTRYFVHFDHQWLAMNS